MKNFFKNVAKTALKASPIPVPDSVLKQVGLHTDRLVDVLDRLQRLEDQINEIVEFIRDVREFLDDEE